LPIPETKTHKEKKSKTSRHSRKAKRKKEKKQKEEMVKATQLKQGNEAMRRMREARAAMRKDPHRACGMAHCFFLSFSLFLSLASFLLHGTFSIPHSLFA